MHSHAEVIRGAILQTLQDGKVKYILWIKLKSLIYLVLQRQPPPPTHTHFCLQVLTTDVGGSASTSEYLHAVIDNLPSVP